MIIVQKLHNKEAIIMIQNINNETNSDIIKLLFHYIIKRIKTQQILSILALLTFGLGDALTGAMMMESRSIGGEANSIVVYIYSNNGLAGLIAAKISFTLVLIFAAFLIYWNSNGKSYWMVNGFLISLVIFGLMASISNIQASLGLSFLSPSKIMFIFFGLILVLVEAGDIIDNQISNKQMNGASLKEYAWQNRASMAK